MKRGALLFVLGMAFLAAGCGSQGTVSATPQTVVGSLPKAAGPTKGDPASGKSLFTAQGCGGCHTYAPAGSKGKIGPALDNLAADAKTAGNKPLDAYAYESIANPGAYVVPKYPNGVMPVYGGQLKQQQISDLVAFLTPKS